MAVARTAPLLCAALISACGMAARPSATQAQGAPVINELFASQPGVDNAEFIELEGTPGTSLAGFSLILVEGDIDSATGHIDRRIDFKPFHQIGANGYFLIGVCEGLEAGFGVVPDKAVAGNFVENSSFTAALVETASLSGDQILGAEAVVDAVGLSDGGTADAFYFNAPVVTSDKPGIPAGAQRIDPGDWQALGQDAVAYSPQAGGLDGCRPLVATVSQIQGREARSPYAGEVVVTSGIVTQYTRDGRHFWLQSQGDGDRVTSDAIFVYDGGALQQPPRVGDHIEITATVEERQAGKGLPVTRLTSPGQSRVLAAGVALPEAVAITDLPDVAVSDAIAFWEPLEGMRVRLDAGLVVGPTSRFGEFVVLAPGDVSAASGYAPESGHLLLRPLQGGEVDYNPERIIVDDASLAEPVIVTPGERVTDLVGVVDYAHGNYKLQAQTLTLQRRPLPASPVDPVARRQGETLIATFNLENLFDTIDDPDTADEGSTPQPGELATKLAKLTAAVRYELKYPDIMAVQEVENTAVLQSLADRIDDAGESDYRATSLGSSDRRGIEVGFLWDARRVSLVDAYLLSGPQVEAAFGTPSVSPGREPLVGVFEAAGHRITLIANHFKSKGEDDPLFGHNQPPLRPSEVQRRAQARVVRDFVDTLLQADPNALVLVAGDLNDFPFPEPGEDKHTLGILTGESAKAAPLSNLVAQIPAGRRYTYIHEGNSQVLDHMLASRRLYGYLTAVDVAHFNAGYPAALAQDAGTPIRASDHDPLVARFDFATVSPEVGGAEAVGSSAAGPLALLGMLTVWAVGSRPRRGKIRLPRTKACLKLGLLKFAYEGSRRLTQFLSKLLFKL